jgi:ankyrin repeat protein
MLMDFKRVAEFQQSGEQSTAAAFHVALCYMIGFGTKIEHSTATQYLRKAEEKAHPMAQLFGARLLSRISNLPITGLVNYTSMLNKGFASKRLFGTNTKIILTFVSGKSKDQELKGVELDTDATQPHIFDGYQKFHAWLVALIKSGGDVTQRQITIGSGPKMNFLECAIAFDDIGLASALLDISDSDWDKIGAWGETALVQATRQGNARMVSLLLDFSHDPCKCDETGASVYHWLFSLTTGNDEATVESLFASLLDQPKVGEALQHACSTPYMLHAQWPLQLLGTPLAFAVMSGSLQTVEALLRQGADPRAPVYAASEDGVPCKWTALHLATKYHFSHILTVLVQRAGEIVRTSHDPLGELGISMANSSHPSGSFRRQEWRGGNIPESLLTEALLEFPHLQLPCVLGHVTTVERYGIHGGDYQKSMREILDILPLSSLEWRCSDGQTGFMQAIDNNDYDLASILLERSPSLASSAFRDPAEKGGYTWPFHFACQIASRRDSEETTKIASAILQLHPRAMLDKDSRLRTALHMSVTGSSSRLSKYLLKHGAPIDAEDMDGSSALHYAGSLANVVALLDGGANINYTNKKGLAAIHLVASIGADDIVAELVRRGAKLDLSNNDLGSPLHCAVIKKSKSSVCSLVQGNAPINARDRRNNTPLILAAQGGRHDIVQILLDGGADISLENESRVTPLRAAVLAKSPALVEKLLNHDISHIATEKSTQTIFHLAAEQADAVTMKVLLDTILPTGMLSVNAVNSILQTPLHVAAVAARADIAQVILEHKPRVDELDDDGATPLLSACGSSKKKIMDANGSRTEFVDVLVQSGAALVTHDHKGRNPWMLARRLADFNLMTYILMRLHEWEGHSLYQLICNKPPDRELIESAIQQEEWDFVTTCLATDAISPLLFRRTILHEQKRYIDRLYYFARRGDKNMVKWVFESSRKGSLGTQVNHRKNPGLRDLDMEFHEVRLYSEPDDLDLISNPAKEDAKEALKTNDQPNSFPGRLRRENSRSSTAGVDDEDAADSIISTELPLNLINTKDSLSPLAHHQPRTPSLGTSLDRYLHRLSLSRAGSK